MTVLSGQTIRRLNLLQPCMDAGKDVAGNSYGLSACGYDLRLAQDVMLHPHDFALASAMERFYLPDNVVGIIHDKSSLARLGLAVQNTVAEPGWNGYLTLELTNHGITPLSFSVGMAICQVIFHFLDEPTELPYRGKYQNQEYGPRPSRSK